MQDTCPLTTFDGTIWIRFVIKMQKEKQLKAEHKNSVEVQ